MEVSKLNFSSFWWEIGYFRNPFSVMFLLCVNPNTKLSRDNLLSVVWGSFASCESESN